MLRSLNNQFFIKIIGQATRLLYNFFFIKYLTNYYTLSQFGNFSYFQSILEKIFFFAEFSTSKAFFRKSSAEGYKPKLYLYYILLTTVLFILIFSIAYYISTDVMADETVLQNKWLLLSSFIFTFILWYLSFQTDYSDSIGYTINAQAISIFFRIFILIILINLFFWGIEIQFEELLLAISFILLFNFLSIWLGIRKKIKSSRNNKNENVFHFYKSLFLFGFPLFISSLLYSSSFILDRWLIQSYQGVEVQAIYGMAYRISLIVMLIPSAIVPILLRVYTTSYEGKIGDTSDLFFSSFNELISIMSAVIAFVLFNLEIIISIVASNEYYTNQPIYYFIIASLIFQSVGQVVSTAFIAFHKPLRVSLIEIVFTFIGIIISLALIIPSNGNLFVLKYDIALKIFIIQAISSIVRYAFFLKVLKKRNYNSLKMGTFLLFAIILNYILNHIITYNLSFPYFILKLIIYVCVIIFLILNYGYPFNYKESFFLRRDKNFV